VLLAVEKYLQVLDGRGSGTGWSMGDESAVAAAVLRRVPAPIVFDGGANIGLWSVGLHRALSNPHARYYLFEPQASCQSRLAGLPLPNLTVFPIALGADDGTEVTISGSEPGSGATSLYERHDTFWGDIELSAHKETVRMRTIDAILAEEGIQVDLLKLDLEGAELDAFRGATTSLASGQIRTVMFEFGAGDIWSRSFFRDVWDLLSPMGYDLHRILPGGRLMHVAKYSEVLEHFNGVSNYLAHRLSQSRVSATSGHDVA
jgi:FkbM family methyltransferase